MNLMCLFWFSILQIFIVKIIYVIENNYIHHGTMVLQYTNKYFFVIIDIEFKSVYRITIYLQKRDKYIIKYLEVETYIF